MAYLCILVFFVFFAGLAMTVNEGLWNNAVNLIAIMLSAAMAAAVGPPVGALMLEKSGKPDDFMWYFIFAGTWLTYFLSVMVFRVVGERISRTRVKFVPPLDKGAGILVGLLAALMHASFVAFTLYAMPIRAGEWDLSKATGWQKSTMQSGSGPMFTVLRSTLGPEIADGFFAQ